MWSSRVRSGSSLLVALAVMGSLVLATSAAPRRGGTLRIAEIGEPLTMDVVATTATQTSNITHAVFEELLAFDASWHVQPMLADSVETSRDGLSYTFKLRKGVRFHNGKEMTSEDVVASLNRWGKMSPRGTVAFKSVDSVAGPDKYTVVMKLKEPFAPMAAFIAYPNGAAAIMPKEVIDATGAGQLKQYIGTGPYKFVEWVPDRHVKLARFENYVPRAEPPSLYAGKREALADEVYFYPVAQIATRTAGVQSGDYDLADQTPSTDAYQQVKKDSRVVVEPIRPGAFLTFFFNKKQGIMANEKLRQAVEVALDMQPIMKATFGDPELFSLGPSIYPKGTPWYTEAGQEWYNVHDLAKAKQLMKEAGYNGEPVRWLTTQQYDYMFKSTVVAAAQLQHAGFNVNMQVLEWAGVLDHRAKPADYDLFTTSHGFVVDPALITVFSSTYPGWWDSSEKNQMFSQFNQTTDQAARAKIWGRLQSLWYKQATLVRPGEFYSLYMWGKSLQGFHPSDFIVVWNVQTNR
jgi:peptide/nickel transport system substrate-binding protein